MDRTPYGQSSPQFHREHRLRRHEAGRFADGGEPGKPGRFAFLQRFFAGPDSDDPLYLTNQTTGQKVRRALRLAIPLVLIVGVAMAGILVWGPKKKEPHR